MGGDIAARERTGKGSTFTVRLPAIEKGTAGRDAVAGFGLCRRRPAPPGGAGRTAGLALVIDDDPGVRELMERLGAREGFDVAISTTGAEGLRLAAEKRPRVITLDVVLPDTDGWKVLETLRADAEMRRTPVVVVTVVDDRSRYLPRRVRLFRQAREPREARLALLAAAQRTRLVTDRVPLRLAMSGVATPETLEAIQAFVIEGCRKAGADEAAAFDLRLAVDEACTNVAVHGYAGAGPGPIDVVLESDGARIRVSITDRGVAVPARARGGARSGRGGGGPHPRRARLASHPQPDG